MRRARALLVISLTLVGAGCADDADVPDAGMSMDSGRTDAGLADDTGVGPDANLDGGGDAGTDGGPMLDSGVDGGSGPDVGPVDVGPMDTGTSTDAGVSMDAGPTDSGVSPDADVDSGVPGDTGVGADSGIADSGGVLDSGTADSGVIADSGVDAGPVDSGVPPTGIGGVWDWSRRRTGPGRSGRNSVWTGYELLTTEGRGAGGCVSGSDGYNPWTETWRGIQGGHVARIGAGAWTGSELIAWSGYNCGLSDYNVWEGRRIDPATGRERRMSVTGAPHAVDLHQAFWTGQYVVFVGGICGEYYSNSPSCPFPGPGYLARYDPFTDSWLPSDVLNVPASRDPAVVWTGTELIVWENASENGRYDPAIDMWSPISVPAVSWLPSGDMRNSTWTGTEMVVFDGTNGAAYDPSTDTWRQMPTAGQPSSTGAPYALVYNGDFILVVSHDRAARFDVDNWIWRPVDMTLAFYPYRREVYWTGLEFLIRHGGDTQGARIGKYGPKLTGDPACDGGAAPLEAVVYQPGTRVIADEVQDLFGVITNTNSVIRIEWSVDGTVVANGTTGTYDFSSLPAGTHNVRFEAEDAQGNIACHDRTVWVDRPPTISREMPPNPGTADPTIRVAATCSDDWNLGCELVLRTTTGVSPIARSEGSLDTTVDLSANRGSFVTFYLDAYDGRGQRTQQQFSVYVAETNASLARHTAVEGELCDFNATHALYRPLTGAGLVWQELSSGNTFAVPAGNGTPICSESKVVDSGVLQVSNAGEAMYWDGSTPTTWPVAFIEAEADVMGRAYSGRRIMVHDFGGGTTEIITSDRSALPFDIAPDGSAVFVDRFNDTYFHPPGGPSELVIADENQSEGRTDGINVIYRFRDTNGDFGIAGDTGAGTTQLVAPRDDWPENRPLPDTYYDANGGWMAWTVPDALGMTQVWTRNPGGTVSIGTGFGDSTELRALGPNGELLYWRAGRLVYDDGNGVIDVGPDHGEPRWIGSTLYVRFGNDVYALQP